MGYSSEEIIGKLREAELGMRKVGSGSTDADGSISPGSAIGAAALIATGKLAGLISSTGVNVYGVKIGKSKIEGGVEQTAKGIATTLKKRFQEQGWI